MADTPVLDPINEPGPFSGLFDYPAEAKLEEEKQLKLADGQRKIMRTNAIGDAFRLLIDGVGGSVGATITPKGINPGIANASSRLDALNKAGDEKMDRLKLMDITNKTRDLQYQQGLEAEERQSQRVIDAEGRSNEQYNTRYTQKRADDVADQGTEFDNSKKLDDHRTKNTIKEIKERNKDTTSTSRRNTRQSTTDFEFKDPDTKQMIYLSDGEVRSMLYKLSNGKNKYDPKTEEAIKNVLDGDDPKKTATAFLFSNHWDEIKTELPEYQKQAELENDFNTIISSSIPLVTKRLAIKKMLIDELGYSDSDADVYVNANVQ